MTPTEEIASEYGEGLSDDGCWITPNGTIVSVPNCGHCEVSGVWRRAVREAEGMDTSVHSHNILPMGGIRVSFNAGADVTIQWEKPTKEACRAFRSILSAIMEYEGRGGSGVGMTLEADHEYTSDVAWVEIRGGISARLEEIRAEASGVS